MSQIEEEIKFGKYSIAEIVQEMEKLGFDKTTPNKSTLCYYCNRSCNAQLNPVQLNIIEQDPNNANIETSVLDSRNVVKKVRFCTKFCNDKWIGNNPDNSLPWNIYNMKGFYTEEGTIFWLD